ncbi:unnamed protein product [Phytophthora fragariaefolia]|uniref:Unnamed protein product n=1 Tax=Phytophthora fragariaefolia TaxID=1490495 RepID=A0A9W6XYA5_9STRA|nr:unnamed protein product [Phytophthora fragariaefolia]
MVLLRFSASKVALVTGLHDFGDAAEALLDAVYQDREELLARDAARLRLRVVTKDDELEALVRKSGAAAAPQLRAALRWAQERREPAHVEEAAVDYSLLAGQSQRTTILKKQPRRAAEAVETVDLTGEGSDEDESAEEEEPPDGYFSICGMVDGVADALTISADDEWELTPVVVEVKNRVSGFRNPPPLYDHIQLAVYMKMLGVEHGDLVQCIYGADSRPNILVSRVSLGVAPLCLPRSAEQQTDIWTEVIVPRLYAFTAAVQKLRNEELLRLAFLNGSEEERRAVLRAECDFL